MMIDEIKVIKGTEKDVIRLLSDIYKQTFIEVNIKTKFLTLGFHIFTQLKDRQSYFIYYYKFPDTFLFVAECKYTKHIEIYISEFYDKYLDGELNDISAE